MIFWAIVAGALFGTLAMGGPGFVLGGFFGAGLGFWLRTAVQAEIAKAVRAALADVALRPKPEEAAQPGLGTTGRRPRRARRPEKIS